MRTRVRGWRWRRNPLRRRSDVVEAWTALTVAVLLFVGAPLAGALVGWWAHDEARSVAAAQRAERRQVRAEVVGKTPATLPTTQSGREHPYRVDVRWSDPVTGTHTATARVPSGTRHGDTVKVWFDSEGRPVAPPPGVSEIWQHTVSLGICAAGGTLALALLGGTLIRHTAHRNRLLEWERAWARTEPEWTRRGV